MRPGVVGAVVVGLVGVAAGAAVWFRDAAQLAAARKARDDAQAALGTGDLPKARAAFEEALAAADGVGGLTGQRGAALDVADEARVALAALDALLAADQAPRGALRLPGPDGAVLGRPAGPLQPLLDRAQAEVLLDAGLALEAREEAVALAPRVLEAAGAAARAHGSPRAPEAEQALGRAKLRARLHELELLVRQARDAEAEAALAGLRSGLADLTAFPEAERAGLRARLEVAAAEVTDRQGVKRFEDALAALGRRVPTNDLGRLRGEAEALQAPALRGGHPEARPLELRLEEARRLHARVLGAARDFEGMVVARRDGAKLVFVDQTEVTNEAFARFVAAGGYGEARWWSPDAQPLLDRFHDATGKPGPAPWKDGKPPEGKERHPVSGVCVHEALAYAAWCGKRLPTMAEWRAAATGDREAKYPWGDEPRAGMANVREPGGERPATKPVGTFPGGAGPTGALDMTGNVRELVRDGGEVLAVGGSFKLRPQDATVQSQLRVSPLTIRPDDVGFRCARDLEW